MGWVYPFWGAFKWLGIGQLRLCESAASISAFVCVVCVCVCIGCASWHLECSSSFSVVLVYISQDLFSQIHLLLILSTEMYVGRS